LRTSPRDGFERDKKSSNQTIGRGWPGESNLVKTVGVKKSKSNASFFVSQHHSTGVAAKRFFSYSCFVFLLSPDPPAGLLSFAIFARFDEHN
jgi:hypothetical protein